MTVLFAVFAVLLLLWSYGLSFDVRRLWRGRQVRRLERQYRRPAYIRDGVPHRGRLFADPADRARLAKFVERRSGPEARERLP